MSINEKLINIQSELKAPKNQYNAFGKYKYRSCEDILEAVKPILKKNGCVLTISDTIESVDGWHYIKATVVLSDGESTVQTTAFAREEETKKGMDASQITGCASSYARKYALNGLFLIDDTKDADAQAPAKEPLICECCGEEIKDFSKNGKVTTADAVARASRKKFGKTLCCQCAMAMKGDSNGEK